MTDGVKASDLPKYHELIYPVLLAVEALGGSAQGKQISARATEIIGATDSQIDLTYKNRSRSVLLDRLDWARSNAKLGGALDSPQRSLFLLTEFGKTIVAMPEAEARAATKDMDRLVRAARRAQQASPTDATHGEMEDEFGDPARDDAEASADVPADWKEALLRRLHRLTPDGFEEFALYLLRTFGLELTRVGGTGDEGIDGIGLAPISPVLSSRVAVQAKRHDPAKTIGREVVALFQRDASAAGAERAVLVALGRFSPAAQKAATMATPNVDLIDGHKICELVHEKRIGVRMVPEVVESWFDRFDD